MPKPAADATSQVSAFESPFPQLAGERQTQCSFVRKRDILRAAGLPELLSLAITVVLGGQAISWQEGLLGGAGSFLLSVGLIGFSYYAFCLCLAEMISCLKVPFSG